jgi:hypothetical protein
VDGHDRASADLISRWASVRPEVPLQILRHDGDLASSIAGYAAALSGGADVTVIVPSPAHLGVVERLRRGRAGTRLARALAPYPNVRVTLVREHPRHGHGPAADDGHGMPRVLPRPHHRVAVLVDKADRASLRAIRYALSLGGEEVVAIHAAVDPDLQEELIDRWMELRVPVPLDLVECWDRDVARSLERRVTELMSTDAEVTVVLPRRDHATLRQRLLHDRTSRKITRSLGRHEHVDIAVVPFFFPAPGHRSDPLTADRTVAR